MTKQEKLLREAIRREIRKELNEFSWKDIKGFKSKLGKASGKITGTLATKFGQMGKSLAQHANKIKNMGSTQKVDFLALLIGGMAQVTPDELQALIPRIKKGMAKQSESPNAKS